MANDILHTESFSIVDAWNSRAAETVDSANTPKIKLPHIGSGARSREDSVAMLTHGLNPRDQSDLSAARLSPRPGRKLRLSVGQDDRVRSRSVSPRSPRTPRPTKPHLGQDAPSAAGSGLDSCLGTSPPRDLPKNHSVISADAGPSLSQPKCDLQPASPKLTRGKKTTVPKTVPPRSAKTNGRSDQSGVLGSSPPFISSRNSPRPCRSPRLDKVRQRSSESEEEKDSPRALSPLPPINVSPRGTGLNKTKGEIPSAEQKHVNFDDEKQPDVPKQSSPRAAEKPTTPAIRQRARSPGIVKSNSLPLETDGLMMLSLPSEDRLNCPRRKPLRSDTPNWLLQDEPAFTFPDEAVENGDDGGDCSREDAIFMLGFPDRIPLPDASTIFQQALSNMNSSRPSSCENDPGDLHVRRSSLVTSFFDLAAVRETVESPPRFDLQLDVMSPLPENDPGVQPRLTASSILKISNWANRSRKISAPTKLLTIDQPSARAVSPKRRVVSEVAPPRREYLEVSTDKSREKKISDSASDSILSLPKSQIKDTPNPAQNEVEISRPLLSKRAMFHVMKFIHSASSGAASTSVNSKSLALLSRGNTQCPAIPSCSSVARRARSRRDSLRIVQQLINDGIHSGDTTEITSFDELRNCRYIRNFRPEGGLEEGFRKNKMTVYNEW